MKPPENPDWVLTRKATRRGYWWAWAILLLGVAATLWATFYVSKTIKKERHRDFLFACGDVEDKIATRLRDHERVLRSGAAFFEHDGGVTRQQWRRFVEHLKLDKELPGIQGIGFALLIPREQMARHIQKIRAEGFAGYEVRPPGDREVFSSIIYLEPFTNRNLRAFGYDMLSEPVRQAAMNRARDEDSAALSGKVVLVQETDEDVQAGTLMYLPVYDRRMPHSTLAQRREAIVGWVYSPYRMTDLMRGILGGWDQAGSGGIHLRVFDGDKTSAANLLYDSQPGRAHARAEGPGSAHLKAIRSAGRQWTLCFTPSSEASVFWDYGEAWLVLLCGMSSTLLLGGLFYTAINTRFRAEEMAVKATAELRRIGNEQRIILDSIPLGVSFVRNRKVQWANLAHDAIFGCAPKESIGLDTSSSYLRKEDYEGVGREGSALLAQGGVYSTELEMRRKDGSPFWCRLIGRAVNASNLDEGSIWILADTTEARRMEMSLRESDERFSSFFRSNPVAAAMSRMDNGQFLEVNDSFLNLFGLSRGEVLGHTALELQLWAFPAEREGFMRKLGDAGRVRQMEAKFRRKSGEIGDVLISAEIIEMNGQRFIFAMFLDISERKRAAEALRQSQERLHLATEAARIGVWDWDVARNELVWDESMYRLYDIRQEDFAGAYEAWLRRVHPEDAARVDGDIQAALRGESEYAPEFRVIHPDGAVRFIQAASKTFRDQDGRPVRMIGTNLDITERKVAEGKALLEAQNRQLQKAESLGRMAGAVAHHFNNQLQVVMMNLDFALKDGASGQAVAESLDAALHATRRASEVSGLMLTYLGKAQSKRLPMSLSSACLQALPMLRAILPKGILLEHDLPLPGPVILADASQVQQVVTNLITNAWEAEGDSKGLIRLSVKTAAAADITQTNRFPVNWRPQTSAYACLEVTDEGCGISVESIEKIFDPFFTTKFTGRGMGLPVVLGIAEAHQGCVAVESELGKRSIFRVFFPVTTAAAPAAVTPEPHTLALAGGRTVLVVEDESSVRKAVASALNQFGFTVLTAEDGAATVALFQSHPGKIDLVLSDLSMPRMNGWETLAALRKLAPDLPVILSSGYNEAQAMADQHSELPQAFLGKPYQLQELRDTVARILDKA